MTKRTRLGKTKEGHDEHRLQITAIDDHVVLDQWMIALLPDYEFYVIPTAAR